MTQPIRPYGDVVQPSGGADAASGAHLSIAQLAPQAGMAGSLGSDLQQRARDELTNEMRSCISVVLTYDIDSKVRPNPHTVIAQATDKLRTGLPGSPPTQAMHLYGRALEAMMQILDTEEASLLTKQLNNEYVTDKLIEKISQDRSRLEKLFSLRPDLYLRYFQTCIKKNEPENVLYFASKFIEYVKSDNPGPNSPNREIHIAGLGLLERLGVYTRSGSTARKPEQLAEWGYKTDLDLLKTSDTTQSIQTSAVQFVKNYRDGAAWWKCIASPIIFVFGLTGALGAVTRLRSYLASSGMENQLKLAIGNRTGGFTISEAKIYQHLKEDKYPMDWLTSIQRSALEGIAKADVIPDKLTLSLIENRLLAVPLLAFTSIHYIYSTRGSGL